MTTEPLYCFEYPPAGILARAIGFSSALQIIQRGQVVAEYAMNCNGPVGFAPNGLLLYDTSFHPALIDLTAPFPQQPRKLRKLGVNVILHPDGRHALAYQMAEYPYTDPTTRQPHSGLVQMDLQTGAAHTLWQGDTTNPRFVALFDQSPELEKARRWQRDPLDKPVQYPDVFIASDGATWTLAKPDRLLIGRGDRLLANLYWNELHFYPVKIAFDLARERVLLTGGAGLVAFTLDGKIAAQWQAIADERELPVCSPAAFWNDHLLAVVRVKDYGYNKPRAYEVWRFDPDTLAPLGRLEGLPRRRDKDEEFGLLPLADGSLAWVCLNQPLTILPAPGTAWRSTEVLRVVGDEPPPLVPAPQAAWYDPAIGEMGDAPPLAELTAGQRKSLARYLLNEQLEDDAFGKLLRLDAKAFQPYAAQVLKWNIEKLRRLHRMDFRNFRLVARGASDAAVDALAAMLRKKLPAINKDRALLLIGADTPRALEHLGELARASAELAALCADHHLEIPAAGPAIRRCSPQALDINAYEVEEGACSHTPGLAFPLPAAEFLPENRGWTCHAPVAHLLTARLDLLPGKPLAASPLKAQHWFLAGGEECCDESAVGHALAYRALPGAEQQVELIANLSYPDQAREGECEYEGEPGPVASAYRLALEPYRGEELEWPNERLGQLGGYPEWWQNPEVPTCPQCGRLMFYVGQVKAATIRNDVIDAALYAFHCEDCGIGAQIVQIT